MSRRCKMNRRTCILLPLTIVVATISTNAFSPLELRRIPIRIPQQQHPLSHTHAQHYHHNHHHRLYAKKKTTRSSGGGFGASSPSKKKSSSKAKGGRDLISTLNDDDTSSKKMKNTQTYNKSDQEQMLNELAEKSESTIIGQAVAKYPEYNTPDMDPFWQLLPSLISTKFPTASDDQLQRVAGMVEFSLGVRGPEEEAIVNQWRPHTELHAYMPDLGDTSPFLDPNELELCKLLSENYDVITKEYEALLEERFDRKGNDRFQSVTSMNCKFFLNYLMYDCCLCSLVLVSVTNMLAVYLLDAHQTKKMNQDGKQWYYSTTDTVLKIFHITYAQ